VARDVHWYWVKIPPGASMSPSRTRSSAAVVAVLIPYLLLVPPILAVRTVLDGAYSVGPTATMSAQASILHLQISRATRNRVRDDTGRSACVTQR